ncbi:hypothetical protein [Saccharicrinis fermentans]|uniref:Oxygen tolerance n=1 Tax=Saccharicrinis fermentans DSM 9555 = JCM 21142 TaxID=869213 RepID=W7Y448_9BACT|nr:hypothetical protein [Saccharicrinis fermentans]GAF02348.1 hypothetical protein JCM21142_3982 [Saccharicrinis fermentans DSM 9555 = JCM 21142]
MKGLTLVITIKRFCLRILMVASLWVLLGYNAISQQVSVTATLDSAMILIGGQMDLKLEVSQPAGLLVNFPHLTDTITKNIEIVEKGQVDSLKLDNDRLVLSQLFRITSFDSGLHYIPPIEFEVIQNEVRNVAASNALSLMVVNPFKEVDPEKGVTDIKGPHGAPFKIEEILDLIYLYGGIALALGLLIWLFIYLRKKRNGEGRTFIKAKPKEPAHIIALRELDKIKDAKLWEHHKVKEFYTQVSNIIRAYIEHRYDQPAMELTSIEIFNAIKYLDIDKKSMEQLRQVLELADLVKFAKFDPLADENALTLMNAYFFVNQTKKEEMKTLEEVKETMLENNAEENSSDKK